VDVGCAGNRAGVTSSYQKYFLTGIKVTAEVARDTLAAAHVQACKNGSAHRNVSGPRGRAVPKKCALDLSDPWYDRLGYDKRGGILLGSHPVRPILLPPILCHISVCPVRRISPTMSTAEVSLISHGRIFPTGGDSFVWAKGDDATLWP